MRKGYRIAAIIPVLNEEEAIGKVLLEIPRWVDEVIVVDNGSTDDTAQTASALGARVVFEARRGYGSACKAGIAAIENTDVVVFLDGDHSDYPQEMNLLVDPIINGEAELVIGSRALGRKQHRSIAPQARFGNWLACMLIRLFWRIRFTDLGPFRAIRVSALDSLNMRDSDYGWTVEMQIKAAQKRIRTVEVPVSYRRRIGKSKISGTLRGVFGAGVKILSTIFLSAFDPSPDLKPQARELVIVFTRYPEPGKAKTRLIPALGAHRAAEIHRLMAEHTLATVTEFEAIRPASVEVRYEGGSESLMTQWLGRSFTLRSQGDGDLGRRLERAFRDAFLSGMKKVVVLGTDCPDITADILCAAFDALDHSDLVIGPANDGGYYMVGLGRSVPSLFQSIPWGTEKVLNRTLMSASELGIRSTLLGPLDDVDRPEDLARLEGYRWTARR